jgi:hypothetical protein
MTTATAKRALSSMQAPWLRTWQVREIVPIGTTKLYELIGSGRIQSKRVDGMRLIDRASLERYAKGGT